MAGFIYVAGATESRSNPLLSRKEEDGNKKFYNLISYISSRSIRNSEIDYCHSSGLLSRFVIEVGYSINLTDNIEGAHWTLLDGSTNFEDIVLFEGFGKRIITSGFLSFYLYNYFCYVTPFFIGIHFTYLDYFPFLQKIVINK